MLENCYDLMIIVCDKELDDNGNDIIKTKNYIN